MRDESRARSPDRGLDSDPRAHRDRSYDERQDSYYRSRQDSRSPPRQAFHDDPRERDSRYRDADMYYERDRGGRHGGYDDGCPGRHAGSRSARRYPRDDHDFGGMYDEGYRGEGDYRDRYEEDRYREGNSRYRDSEGYGSRSPSGSHYNRSRSHSPTRDAGRPSDTVILEGLPFGISASELRESILNNSIAAEFPSIDVRVSSSKGNRRAFVQFQEIDHAVAFMREHFPKLLIDLTHSTDDVPDGRFNAYIHYARSREDTDARGVPGSNWVCPSCDFSNYSTRNKCKVCGGPQSAPNWQASLTGVTDAANVPSQILVVYPLAPFVNEEMFANDIKKLELEKVESSKDNANGAPKLKSTAPGDTTGYGARPGSTYRVFLIRDVNTRDSFKYGFVEFWTLEDATAAMAKFQRARTFNIAACPVTVSNIHMGVFVPDEREVTPGTEHMSFNPLFNPEIRVRYRDYHVYPSQRVINSQPPDDGSSRASNAESNEAKKSKKRKAEGGLPTGAPKKLVPMAGQMAMWQKKRDELRGEATGSGQDDGLPETADNEEGPASSKGNGISKSGSQGPIKISLSGNTKLGAPPATASKSASPSDRISPAAEAGSPPPEKDKTPQASDVSYVDRERLMCLICMRKYKSVDEVNIHERSRNHKTAMENEELVKAALPRLAARDKRMQKQAPESPDSNQATSQYRDRAKERREAYNQPNKPVVTQAAKPKTDKKPSKPEEDAQPAAKPGQSKGAGMLAKMGWTAGAGLGANGDGRTEVVATNAYQEGVGLGAEGGNLGDAAQLAERKTKNSYADYVNTVQDKARERYNNMN